MADSTPLLSEPNSDEPQPPVLHKHLPSLDSIIERCIGDFGWAQFLQAILVAFSWFFDAQQTFIAVFTDSVPTWHCTHLTELPNSCNSASNICQLPQNAWAWDRAKHTSIISEWGLECSSSLITGLPASAFFIGCLIGGLTLATLADTSLGRKNMLFLSCLIMSLSTFLTAFSTNIWVYSFLRFITGFARATIGTSALVLSTELVGKRWRGQVGVMGFFCFTLGWLFVRGRKEDAIETLKYIAPVNSTTTKTALTSSFISSLSFEHETGNIVSGYGNRLWYRNGVLWHAISFGKLGIRSLLRCHAQRLVRIASFINRILFHRQNEQKNLYLGLHCS
ncbi:organic cation/carnitine transporter 3-like [Pyrus ussuriensis x Pyrus communis]|uniref:Organic cation/carnitine transporter 3-like n=1 Tax=Pyrus ussuriensis x Pyrus communis TaxID=2448454 RepID=A0A5N5I9U0_9ROSA|nr:organic cation/carnitine transporter 3-like [Pyrus ussuriensis x Pyrus communis]